jgi:HK97 family phage major capsid protein
MLSKKIEQRKANLAELEAQETALLTRAAELETALEEATTDEEIAAVETDAEEIDTEKAGIIEKKSKLEGEITGLEKELEELNAKEPKGDPEQRSNENKNHIREDGTQIMKRYRFFKDMTREAVKEFFTRSEVKEFIDNIRSIKTRGVTNGNLTVPEVMFEMLRNNLETYSKLAKYVTVKPVSGTARQNIMGAYPEGVWMEAEGELNELDMALNQIEVDGFMVGGILWIHNNLLKDSDEALGSEIMEQLGRATGKGTDRGILYGTGVKMPLGIVTRLAQTAAPSNWGAHAPTWTDLHTSNIKKLNINATTGAAFYASLVENLGIAKPDYSDGKAFWVMNRKTHINLMTKALAFDAAAALLAGVNNQMPIIGGDIVEMEIVGDNEIIGGFGSVYLLAEREGSMIESSEHAKWAQNLTGFKGYARYDGMPVFGEAFVIVSFDNTDAATTSTFPIDYANTALGALGVTSVAGTLSGDTLITVTGAEVSGTTLGYKVAGKAASVACGDANTGYTVFTTPDDITAATGKVITVVEFDANGRAIKVGTAQIVAKA